jgi:ribulose-phosphate 3-epimerase
MCADLLHIESQVKELEHAGVDLFHVDVMDGHFVPNLGLNFDLVRQLKRLSKAKIDVHLMVESPSSYLELVDELKIDLVSFHIEACSTPLRLAKAIKSTGAKSGIALNPSTPLQALRYVLDDFDYVLVMTVEPGFAGQRFIPSMYGKIQDLREMLERIRPGIDIQVDGNLDVDSSIECIRRGATILVAGTSSVFKPQQDVHTAYMEFQRQLTDAAKPIRIDRAPRKSLLGDA